MRNFVAAVARKNWAGAAGELKTAANRKDSPVIVEGWSVCSRHDMQVWLDIFTTSEQPQVYHISTKERFPGLCVQTHVFTGYSAWCGQYAGVEITRCTGFRKMLSVVPCSLRESDGRFYRHHRRRVIRRISTTVQRACLVIFWLGMLHSCRFLVICPIFLFLLDF